MKTMEQTGNKLVGILCGIGGGMGRYLLQISDAPFIVKLCQAGTTALVCGVLGAMGKHMYDLITKRK